MIWYYQIFSSVGNYSRNFDPERALPPRSIESVLVLSVYALKLLSSNRKQDFLTFISHTLTNLTSISRLRIVLQGVFKLTSWHGKISIFDYFSFFSLFFFCFVQIRIEAGFHWLWVLIDSIFGNIASTCWAIIHGSGTSSKGLNDALKAYFYLIEKFGVQTWLLEQSIERNKEKENEK